MVKLDVIRVAMDWSGRSPVLLLKEQDGPRMLSLWIGHPEAKAIATALEGQIPPRPLTHDLVAELLTVLGHHEVEGVITAVTEGVYDAELHVGEHVVGARPSDLAALAARSALVLSCAEQVIDQVGFVEDIDDDDDVEKFREFLDHVNPDDFEG